MTEGGKVTGVLGDQTGAPALIAELDRRTKKRSGSEVRSGARPVRIPVARAGGRLQGHLAALMLAATWSASWP